MSNLRNKQQEVTRGKARSSNGARRVKTERKTRAGALKLEFTGECALFPGEDQTAYVALNKQLKKDHRPVTPIHFELVDRATSLIWRLRRLRASEAAIFTATARSLGYHPESSPDGDSQKDAAANVGEVLDVMLKNGALNRITDYEASLRDQLQVAAIELDALTDWHIKYDFYRSSVHFALAEPPEDENGSEAASTSIPAEQNVKQPSDQQDPISS